MNDLQKQVGSAWDKKVSAITTSGGRAGPNWWNNTLVLRHVNRLVCGQPIKLFSAGCRAKLRDQLGYGVCLRRGVSIGCGTGVKEMSMIMDGLVECFDLYELSSSRIDLGKQKAKDLGLSDRINFFHGDAFTFRHREQYDIVHWDNSLHHMLDVNHALRWSRQNLRPGGWLFMNDFIGPSRFQWTENNLQLCNRIRSLLPARCFQAPGGTGKGISRGISRPEIDAFIAKDPSEAADSSNILPSINAHFPSAVITMTGGALYHIGFAGIYANLDMSQDEDRYIVESMLLADELAMKNGESHYAFALAQV